MTGRILRFLVLIATLVTPLPTLAGVHEDIIIAARDNRADIVVDLLQRGMDPNTSDHAGTTLLMFAVANGNEELVEFILINRANILKQNRFGDSAVSLAALNGNLTLVRRLIAAGADIAAPGWNPLHYAAFNGHTEIVRFLVAKGAARCQLPWPVGVNYPGRWKQGMMGLAFRL